MSAKEKKKKKKRHSSSTLQAVANLAQNMRERGLPLMNRWNFMPALNKNKILPNRLRILLFKIKCQGYATLYLCLIVILR